MIKKAQALYQKIRNCNEYLKEHVFMTVSYLEEEQYESLIRVFLIFFTVLLFSVSIFTAIGSVIGIASINMSVGTGFMSLLFYITIKHSQKEQWKIARFVPPIAFIIVAIEETYLWGINETNIMMFSIGVMLYSLFFQILRKWYLLIGLSFISIFLQHISPRAVPLEAPLDNYAMWIFILSMYYLLIAIIIQTLTTQYVKAFQKVSQYTEKLQEDIEMREKAQKILLEATTQAEESRKIKEQLFVNMSHELRTPMNAVIGIINLLPDTPLSKQQVDYVRALKLSANNLLDIINDILDYSKIETGNMEIQARRFSLHNLIRNSLDSIEHQATTKGLAVHITFDPKIPETLLGDSVRLNQIILNLINNAIKFTKHGSINVDAQLLHIQNNIAHINLSIRDTGVGIPEDKLSEIFESYKQADNELTREYGGTGLGLYIVKKLVEAQGGTIQVSSTIEVGSTFSITIPYEISQEREKESKSFKENSTIKPFPTTLNILLAEDNVLNQMVTEQILTKWNITITIAKNGEEVIQKVKKNQYDLILMDIQMPKVDGYIATKQIRAMKSDKKKKIPIVAMSAHATETEKQRAIDLGMNHYIVKPFVPYELFQVIKNLT